MTAPTADFITALRSRDFTVEGHNWRACAHGDEQFAAWLVLVDYEMRERVGYGLHDIPDRDWRALYAAEIDPAAIATFLQLATEPEPHEGNPS